MEYILENPPLEIQKIGRWWNNREEIDIAAVSAAELLVGECKWWDNEVGMNVLGDLQRKAALIQHEGKSLYYALFAKKGFTEELHREAKSKKNILLYDFSGTPSP